MGSGRPLGVTVSGSLNRFFGALWLLGTLALMFFAMSPDNRQSVSEGTGVPPERLDLVLLWWVFMSAARMMSGHWALKGQQRGRLGMIGVESLGLVNILIYPYPNNLPVTLAMVAYNAFVIWYFMWPGVRAWFGQSVVRPL